MSDDEQQEAMRIGREAFDRGDYFAAHEHWEAVWIEAAEPERTWVQGLIQLATGLHKLAQKRPDLCARLLRKALAKLTAHGGAPGRLWEVDVAAGRRGAEEILGALERGEGPDPGAIQLAPPPPTGSRRS